METRDRMIEAAGRVMRTRGLARSTTKEIAREAGYSEGTIYKHFESKEELFICVLTERFPAFADVVRELPQRSGRGSLEKTFEDVASAALDFYAETFPMSASIFSEPDLLARHREEIRKQDTGPRKPYEALVAYLEGERDLGRIREDADPNAAAAMLLGACFQRAFFENYFEESEPSGQSDSFAKSLAQTLARSLSPGEM